MAYVVTDLTLMNSGNVCLACLEEEQLFCVRPLFNQNAYHQVAWYEQNGIRQGTKLDLTFHAKSSELPHSEDVICTAVNTLGKLDDSTMQELLEENCHCTIVEGFGTSPVAGEKLFRHDCELPSRSIITLKVLPENITLNQDTYSQGRIKITITDANGLTLSWLPITDLRYVSTADNDFCALTLSARRADCIYVRLGLGRRYCSPQNQDGYWLQVNGLYIY
jgi:hypothetical protein